MKFEVGKFYQSEFSPEVYLACRQRLFQLGKYRVVLYCVSSGANCGQPYSMDNAENAKFKEVPSPIPEARNKPWDPEAFHSRPYDKKTP